MENTAKAWIANADCNVCIINWTPLSGTFTNLKDIGLGDALDFMNYKVVAMNYTVITANTIHRFMEFLIKHEMRIKDVSMAGHR